MNDPVIRPIPLDRLERSPANVRRTEPGKTAFAELKASIAAHGLLENLVARSIGPGEDGGEHYAVIAGARRLAAAQRSRQGRRARHRPSRPLPHHRQRRARDPRRLPRRPDRPPGAQGLRRHHRPRAPDGGVAAGQGPGLPAERLAVGLPPAHRDILLVGVYTGMHLGEIVSLRWERLDLDRLILRVEETKTGEPLELPITRQLAAIFERRRADCEDPEGWVFPSTMSRPGHLRGIHQYYVDIGRAAGTKFWFHGLRNVFITVAERELMLSRSLTKRLVNHARDDDITEGYAADWTVEQLREPAQHVADRVDQLMNLGV